MATSNGYISLQSEDVIPAATLSMTHEDSAYPVENAQNDNAEDTAKSDTTSTVVTVEIGSTVTPVAATIINTNATTASISNDAGLNEAITIPSRTVDGKPRNGWKNLTGIADRTDDTFYFTMSKSGTAVLEFARLILVVALHDLLWTAGVDFELRRPGAVRNRTRLGSLSRRLSPTFYRVGIGKFVDPDDVDSVIAPIEAAGNGLGQGFLVIPDRLKNDAIFAQPGEDGLKWTDEGGMLALQLSIEEISMGLPPDLT